VALTEEEMIAGLGPLAPLAGTWEGSEGLDEAPAPDRGLLKTAYRERTVFVPIGAADNHEQLLFGLRYSTMAWRIGEPDSFHEEVGYLHWDAASGLVMRSFAIPRAMVVLAGGRATASDRRFRMEAVLGSPTFGIASNPFLDAEFKTVRFELEVDLSTPDRYRYAEDTQLLLKGRSDVFHHRDANELVRVR